MKSFQVGVLKNQDQVSNMVFVISAILEGAIIFHEPITVKINQ